MSIRLAPIPKKRDIKVGTSEKLLFSDVLRDSTVPRGGSVASQLAQSVIFRAQAVTGTHVSTMCETHAALSNLPASGSVGNTSEYPALVHDI
jgi:hypothetical protein